MPIINAPPPPGGAQSDRLYERVMECMGSRTNTANFVITHEDINAVKSNVGHPLRLPPILSSIFYRPRTSVPTRYIKLMTNPTR